jgi:hypothetical protein
MKAISVYNGILEEPLSAVFSLVFKALLEIVSKKKAILCDLVLPNYLNL